MNRFISNSANQTRKLGELLAKELFVDETMRKGAQVICLSGDLGAGKTTLTQGLLKGLKIPGPYTSPTFVIMKHYKRELQNTYHIDAYRVDEKDILSLGWKEMIKDKDSLIIVEWAERIKKIIPADALWITFEWIDENERELLLTKAESNRPHPTPAYRQAGSSRWERGLGGEGFFKA